MVASLVGDSNRHWPIQLEKAESDTLESDSKKRSNIYRNEVHGDC